ncbi:hypothetical protein HGRIS_008722 [Hohenbuehelia grisea]|uniref:XPG-I domain-containing protein n=1 Tax=Hohenbuehelia grisea TaxID=104357 RepID=A0ABR3J960_9AGAR
MGVTGLWDVLRPAGKVRSLTELAVSDGFLKNSNGLRGFRVGIDASIWFFHANWGKEGENPELRTLFFRCATLLHAPFLPLFVFDGPKRPDFKRGKRINTTAHKLTNGMKQIIEAFGFEWRTAPGEAEAELAYLNRVGIIDGILSDDVDTFLFGALTVIRNSSNTLSGNRSNPVLNSDGRDDKNHTVVYRLEDITDDANIALTRGGFILIGLLRGGDYHQEGLPRCGVTIAAALARCGFGDSLYEAARNISRSQLPGFLVNWRNELRRELKTDSKGHLGRKYVSLSSSVPDEFPNIDVLLSYVNPITSESMGRTVESAADGLRWAREPDLGKIAETCEFYFEWGYKEAIIKRFRTVIWPSVVLRILRRSVLNAEAGRSGRQAEPPSTPRKNRGLGASPPVSPFGTPSKMITKHFSSMKLSNEQDNDDDDADRTQNLVVKIHSSRQHASTDKLLEYRLEITPGHLVRLTEGGIKGIRRPEDANEWSDATDEDEDGAAGKSKKAPPDPDSHLRVWMPAAIVRMAEPQIVEEYEEAQRRKEEKKLNKGRKANTSGTASGKGKGKATAKKIKEVLEEEDIPPPPRVSTKSKSTAKAKTASSTLKSFYAVEKPSVGKTGVATKPLAATSKAKKSSVPSPKARRFSLSLFDSDSDIDAQLPAFIYPPALSKKPPPPKASSTAYLSISESESDDVDAFIDHRPRPVSPIMTMKLTVKSSTSSRALASKASHSSPASSPYRPTARAVPHQGKPFSLEPVHPQTVSMRKKATTSSPNDSASAPKRQPKASSSAKRASPEPMQFEPLFASDSEPGPPGSSLSSSPTSTRRKKSDLSSSESDSSTKGRVPKSPRKSTKHSSPRKSGSPCRAEGRHNVERPVSPSPRKGSSQSAITSLYPAGGRMLQAKGLPKHVDESEVIEISSDEEDAPISRPPPKLDLRKVAPLLVARSMTAERMRARAAPPVEKPIAFIDLT